MRGHIRRRGDPGSWEYIIDVGMATAQRCQSCGTRFWMERKPKPCLSEVRRELLETEERRRKTQAGFATRKDAEAAMCKVMTRGRGAQLRRPHSDHRAGVPAARSGCRRSRAPCGPPPSPAMRPTSRATSCRPWDRCSSRVCQRPGDQRLLCQAAGERPPAGQGLPLPRHRAARACHPASGTEGCRALAAALASIRPMPPIHRGARAHRGSCPPGTRSSWPAFSARVKDDRLFALWRLLAMTGCRRGEALGLRWEDLDLEATRSPSAVPWFPSVARVQA